MIAAVAAKGVTLSKAKVALVLFAMMGWPPSKKDDHRFRFYSARADRFAALVVEEARDDEEVFDAGAISMKEGSLDMRSRGVLGEIGFMQIHREGMAKTLCRDLDVYKARDNLRCGLRIMRHARKTCGEAGRLRWLGLYKGHRKCRPSGYAGRVLVIRARGTAVLDPPPEKPSSDEDEEPEAGRPTAIAEVP